MLTKRVRELLDYNLETGELTWKVSRGRVRVGIPAGTVDWEGYRRIKIDGRLYRAHRLIWLIVFGYLPRAEMDHVNGVKDDNRLENLRPATKSQNLRNAKRHRHNTSGVKGVHWSKDKNRWKASFRYRGKKHYVGSFIDLAAATVAVRAARAALHGKFANHGS